MRGVVYQTDLTEQPGTGASPIKLYQSAPYPYSNAGNNLKRDQVTASLDLRNADVEYAAGIAGNGTGTASLTVSKNYPGVQNGTGSSYLGQPVFTDSSGNLETTSDTFSLQPDDIDGDSTEDFFTVELGAGTLNAFSPSGRATTGVFYGGKFAPESALTGRSTATYSRQGGARVNTVIGKDIASGAEGDFNVIGDVSLDVDFTAGTVKGRIDKAGRAGGLGTDAAILLSDARINGVHFDGGTARMVDGSGNDIYGTVDGSYFIGSFMGADAEAAGGVFSVDGTIGGEAAITTGSYIGDRQ